MNCVWLRNERLFSKLITKKDALISADKQFQVLTLPTQRKFERVKEITIVLYILQQKSF